MKINPDHVSHSISLLLTYDALTKALGLPDGTRVRRVKMDSDCIVAIEVDVSHEAFEKLKHGGADGYATINRARKVNGDAPVEGGGV